MLNRATVVGLAVAAAAVLLVFVLAGPAIGPQTSRAEFGTPSISIEGIHGRVDHRKLPIQPIPEP